MGNYMGKKKDSNATEQMDPIIDDITTSVSKIEESESITAMIKDEMDTRLHELFKMIISTRSDPTMLDKIRLYLEEHPRMINYKSTVRDGWTLLFKAVKYCGRRGT